MPEGGRGLASWLSERDCADDRGGRHGSVESVLRGGSGGSQLLDFVLRATLR